MRIMVGFKVLLLTYNLSIDTLRAIDVNYYKIKELKINKIESMKKVNTCIIPRGRKL